MGAARASSQRKPKLVLAPTVPGEDAAPGVAHAFGPRRPATTSILEARASEWAGLPRRTPRAQSAFPSSAALPAALRSRAASSEAFDPGMLDSVGTPEVAFLSSDAMSPFVNVP